MTARLLLFGREPFRAREYTISLPSPGRLEIFESMWANLAISPEGNAM